MIYKLIDGAFSISTLQCPIQFKTMQDLKMAIFPLISFIEVHISGEDYESPFVQNVNVVNKIILISVCNSINTMHLKNHWGHSVHSGKWSNLPCYCIHLSV